VRDRRRQGAHEGDQRSTWTRPRSEVYPSQGAQLARPPPRTRPPQVKARLRRAWAEDDHDRALDQLKALAGELERSHPGAAASLKEGLAETLTITRLGVKGRLKATLQSTNPCESMIETVRHTGRNVKRWQSGEMCPRWTAAGMLEAERQLRKIIGYRDLAKLASPSRKSSTPRRPRRSRFPSHEIINCGEPPPSSTTTATSSVFA
jgi:Transposase, Mutator family